MKKARNIVIMALVLSMIFSSQAFSQKSDKWGEVLASKKAVNIYVADIVNDSKNPDASAADVTKIVKDIFAKRKSTRFNVVNSESGADIVFSGKIVESIWMKKAPITDVYSPGALVFDAATRGSKNYARMRLQYKISEAGTGETLLEQVSQVTIKKPNVPKDKSFSMICKRAPKILTMDIFKRYKKLQVNK